MSSSWIIRSIRPLADLLRVGSSLPLRASHLQIVRRSVDGVAVPAVVELAEISGSETFVHVRFGEVSWVVQEEGVHGFGLGDPVTFYLNPRHLFVFGVDGRLVAAPGRRAAALAAE